MAIIVVMFFSVMAIMVVMFFSVMVVMVEGHVESGVLGVNFYVISVLFFIGEFNGFVGAFFKKFTQVCHQHSLVIECCLAGWHGVNLDSGGCVLTEG